MIFEEYTDEEYNDIIGDVYLDEFYINALHEDTDDAE